MSPAKNRNRQTDAPKVNKIYLILLACILVGLAPNIWKYQIKPRLPTGTGGPGNNSDALISRSETHIWADQLETNSLLVATALWRPAPVKVTRKKYEESGFTNRAVTATNLVIVQPPTPVFATPAEPEYPLIVHPGKNEDGPWTVLDSQGMLKKEGETVAGDKGGKFVIRSISREEVWLSPSSSTGKLSNNDLPTVSSVAQYPAPAIRFHGFNGKVSPGQSINYNGNIIRLKAVRENFASCTISNRNNLQEDFICMFFR